MSDYTKLTDFAAKDALASGNPSKIVLGAELDAEFEAIEAAIATKSDGSGSITNGDKGDVTVSSNGTVWTVYVGVPQTLSAANYTVDENDNGRHIYHASDAGAGDTYTLPANASVALPVGFAVSFINMSADSVSIAITTDTMTLLPGGTTGTRTLAQYGVATAIKVTSTSWVIFGSNLT